MKITLTFLVDRIFRLLVVRCLRASDSRIQLGWLTRLSDHAGGV
jgi:hypothetical protein